MRRLEKFYHHYPNSCLLSANPGSTFSSSLNDWWLNAGYECWLKGFQGTKIFTETEQTFFFISETMTLKIEDNNPKFGLQSPSHNLFSTFQINGKLRSVKTPWKSVRHEADNLYIEYVICLANVCILYSR